MTGAPHGMWGIPVSSQTSRRSSSPTARWPVGSDCPNPRQETPPHRNYRLESNPAVRKDSGLLGDRNRPRRSSVSGHTIVLVVDEHRHRRPSLVGAHRSGGGGRGAQWSPTHRGAHPGPHAVGTTWRETRSMMGKSETQEMTVAVVQPPNRTVVTAEAAGVHYTTEFTLSGQSATGR